MKKGETVEAFFKVNNVPLYKKHQKEIDALGFKGGWEILNRVFIKNIMRLHFKILKNEYSAIQAMNFMIEKGIQIKPCGKYKIIDCGYECEKCKETEVDMQTINKALNALESVKNG